MHVFRRYKSLRFATLANRKKATSLVLTWMDEEIDGGFIVPSGEIVTENETKGAAAPEKPSRFKRFQDDNSKVSDATSEWDRYLAYKLPEKSENDGRFRLTISFV